MGLAAIFAVAYSSEPIVAHGGGLDANGCHWDRKNGDYHCHRSPSTPAPTTRSAAPPPAPAAPSKPLGVAAQPPSPASTSAVPSPLPDDPSRTAWDGESVILRAVKAVRTNNELMVTLPSGAVITIPVTDVVDAPPLLPPDAPTVTIAAHGGGWYVANTGPTSFDNCVVTVRGVNGQTGPLPRSSKASITVAGFRDRFRLGAVLPSPMVKCASGGKEILARVESVEGWLRNGIER